MDVHQRLAAMERLVDISILLTAENKLDRLLNAIVSEGRECLSQLQH